MPSDQHWLQDTSFFTLAPLEHCLDPTATWLSIESFMGTNIFLASRAITCFGAKIHCKKMPFQSPHLHDFDSFSCGFCWSWKSLPEMDLLQTYKVMRKFLREIYCASHRFSVCFSAFLVTSPLSYLPCSAVQLRGVSSDDPLFSGISESGLAFLPRAHDGSINFVFPFTFFLTLEVSTVISDGDSICSTVLAEICYFFGIDHDSIPSSCEHTFQLDY